MEEKPLTESINKQYSKYGSLRVKDTQSQARIELCNAEDPMKFLTRIDSSIKDAKAKVKRTLDNSNISEDYESSYDQMITMTNHDDNTLGNIPLVKLEKNRVLYNRDRDTDCEHIQTTSTSEDNFTK